MSASSTLWFELFADVPMEPRSGRTITHQWRVFGEWNEQTRRYHCDLTNAPGTLIECEDARGLYALRWQIELLFKALKQGGRLHELPSRDEQTVKVLLMAALCWVCLAGVLRELLIPRSELIEVSLLRASRVLRESSDVLLGALACRRASFESRDSLELFRAQLRDPNDLRTRAFAIPALVDYSCGFAA